MLRGNMPQKTTGGACSHFAYLEDRTPVCAFRGLNQHIRIYDNLEIVPVKHPVGNLITTVMFGLIVADLQ